MEDVRAVGVDLDATFGIGLATHVTAWSRAALEHEHLTALLSQDARDRASPNAGPGHDDVDFLHGNSIPQTRYWENGHLVRSKNYRKMSNVPPVLSVT